MGKQITITKVVSRNIFLDLVSKIQNMFGLNLTKYEDMINKGIEQIRIELGGQDLAWHRYEISQLSNGAMAIMFYGETK